MIFTKWEIWWAEVKFAQSDESKVRPILIIDDTDVYYVDIAPITSQSVRENDYFDYEIKEWEQCNLTKPSVIRLGKRIPLLKKRCIRKIGVLSQRDIVNVTIFLNRRK